VSGARDNITFEFDGKTVNARPGDTVASALYRAGQRIFSRSFKYHRPRGLLCLAGKCPNCLMNVDGAPNVRTCMTPVRAGMNVARLNFSHGTHEEHGKVIRSVRAISARLGQSVGILQDLCGPKIRTGALQGGADVKLVEGTEITVTTKRRLSSPRCSPSVMASGEGRGWRVRRRTRRKTVTTERAGAQFMLGSSGTACGSMGTATFRTRSCPTCRPAARS